MQIVRLSPRSEKTASWIINIIVIAVFSVCLSGCASWVDHHFKPTVEVPQGVVAMEGLAGPVTIRRDAYGIPLIEAGGTGDLAMAMGYVNAADRLTQMIGMKLVAQGRVANHMPEPCTSMDSITLFALINLGLSFNLHEEVAALAVGRVIGTEKTA
jgi:acyl-homoserine lactone acylase PvdQ